MNLLFCIHTVTSGVRQPEFRDKFRYGFLSKHFTQQTSNTQEQLSVMLYFGVSLAAEEIKMFLLFFFFFWILLCICQFMPSKLSLHTTWISSKIRSALFHIIFSTFQPDFIISVNLESISSFRDHYHADYFITVVLLVF